MLPALLLIIVLALSVVHAAIIPHSPIPPVKGTSGTSLARATYAMLMGARWLIMANVICIAVDRGGFTWLPSLSGLGSNPWMVIGLLMSTHALLGLASFYSLRILTTVDRPSTRASIRRLGALGVCAVLPLAVSALLSVEAVGPLNAAPAANTVRLISAIVAGLSLVFVVVAWTIGAERHAPTPAPPRARTDQLRELLTRSEKHITFAALGPTDPLVDWLYWLGPTHPPDIRAKAMSSIRERPNLAVEYARLLQSGSRSIRSLALAWIVDVRPPVTGDTLDAVRGILLARASELQGMARSLERHSSAHVDRLLEECWNGASYLHSIGQDVSFGALAVHDAARQFPETPERRAVLEQLLAIGENRGATTAAN